jgi:hypothetical protein
MNGRWLSKRILADDGWQSSHSARWRGRSTATMEEIQGLAPLPNALTRVLTLAIHTEAVDQLGRILPADWVAKGADHGARRTVAESEVR